MFNLFKKKKAGPIYEYTEKELEELERFITEQFGAYRFSLHEIYSPDIHLDICVVDPTEKDPYYKLVTIGAGAYPMKVPAQYKKLDPKRAEYMICLPASWNRQSRDEKDFWPVGLLKETARLPISCDTWLAYGHTTQSDEEGTPYSENSRLNAVILDEAIEGGCRMMLPSGEDVSFWKLIPLYDEELKYKMENGAEKLFDLMKKEGTYSDVLDADRRNTFI